jgi:protein-S-isoprenylcysteine O-methyltransferase Ste14
MNETYFGFFALFMVCLVTRTTYELLKKVGRANPHSKPLFAFIFAAMSLLWISWFAMCPFDPYSLSIPSVVRWSGLGAVFLGLALAIGAIIQLRGLENIDHLVTTGLFSRIRHPLYTGFILWILGWGVFNGAGLSLAVGLIGIGNILYWRWLEEKALLSRYGGVYQKYRVRTWF